MPDHQPAPHDSIRTSRLRLRPPEAGDVGVVLRLHQDPGATAHNPGDALADRDEAQHLLERWLAHWKRHGVGYWAVSWCDHAPVIGFCGVKAMSLRTRPVWNLLYRLEPAVWGRGAATEAATAVVDDVLARFPQRPVVARVRPANRASAAVAIKAGLLRTPELDTEGEDGIEHIYLAPPERRSELQQRISAAVGLTGRRADPLPGAPGLSETHLASPTGLPHPSTVDPDVSGPTASCDGPTGCSPGRGLTSGRAGEGADLVAGR